MIHCPHCSTGLYGGPHYDATLKDLLKKTYQVLCPHCSEKIFLRLIDFQMQATEEDRQIKDVVQKNESKPLPKKKSR